MFIASKLESVFHRTWSQVQAHLNCMEDLLKSPVQWRYLLNTCGSDLPIKTNAEMVLALKMLNGKNSLMSFDMPENFLGRWQYHHEVVADAKHGYLGSIRKTSTRKSPPPIPIFSGSAYFVITRDFVKHVLEDKEIQDFMEWSRDTDCPEEHLWASLNRLSSVPGSVPAHSKYHRSDMNAIARLVHWEYPETAGDVTKGAAYPPCTSSTVRRGICIYGLGELHWLFQHQHLMANKFDPQVDNNVIRCIESILRFKALQPTIA